MRPRAKHIPIIYIPMYIVPGIILIPFFSVFCLLIPFIYVRTPFLGLPSSPEAGSSSTSTLTSVRALLFFARRLSVLFFPRRLASNCLLASGNVQRLLQSSRMQWRKADDENPASNDRKLSSPFHLFFLISGVPLKGPAYRMRLSLLAVSVSKRGPHRAKKIKRR